MRISQLGISDTVFDQVYCGSVSLLDKKSMFISNLPSK